MITLIPYSYSPEKSYFESQFSLFFLRFQFNRKLISENIYQIATPGPGKSKGSVIALLTISLMALVIHHLSNYNLSGSYGSVICINMILTLLFSISVKQLLISGFKKKLFCRLHNVPKNYEIARITIAKNILVTLINSEGAGSVKITEESIKIKRVTNRRGSGLVGGSLPTMFHQ